MDENVPSRGFIFTYCILEEFLGEFLSTSHLIETNSLGNFGVLSCPD